MRWFCILAPILLWSEVCIFTPPTGWQPSKPENLSRAKIGFVQKGSGTFNASLNLVQEAVDCTMTEYLKAVKAVHLAGGGKWTDLGKIEMKAGTGRLTEIRRSGPFGEIVLYQGIYLKDKTAYILTGAVSKKDLPERQKEMISAIRSLDVMDRLWKEPPEKMDWDSYKTLVEKQKELGGYWQYLALEEYGAR